MIGIIYVKVIGVIVQFVVSIIIDMVVNDPCTTFKMFGTNCSGLNLSLLMLMKMLNFI